MSSWVAGQGLFFQLRYGAAVRGADSPISATLMRLFLRLAILILVGLVGLWIFLAKRVDYGWFRNDLGEKISLALGANSAVVGSVKRERGYVGLRQISLEGGEGSFFYDAEIRGLRTRMGLLDGFLNKWSGESISMKSLTIALKGGADTDEEASTAYQSLFVETPKFDFSAIDIENASLNWGYSEIHRGSIQGTHLKANRRSDGGWTVVMKGGLFTQNWLRRFEIERMEVILTEDRFEIMEMKLSKDGGSAELKGKLSKGGARPEFLCGGTMRSLPVWSLIEADYRDFVDGVVSGDLSISGSTNSQEGFSAEAAVELEEGDHVILRDRFPLFRAISAVDRFRSYKKVRFSVGRFHMRTGGDRMELSDIWLRALELMQLEGSVVVRRPTDEEINDRLRIHRSPTIGDGPAAPGTKVEAEKDELSLRDAGEASKKAKERRESDPTRPAILGRSGNNNSVRNVVEEAAIMREKEAYFLDGVIRVGVTKDVFDRSPALDEAFPVDDQSGFRWLNLPMKGSIFSVGKALADMIYLQSRGL